MSITADVYGQSQERIAEKAIVNWHKADGDIKWELIAINSNYMSLDFGNEYVFLDAWFDDMGGLSSFKLNGEIFDIQCAIFEVD